MRPFLSIVSLCVLGAIAYGLIHDQVTARVCPEYFTLGHSTPTFVPRNPTALGLFWGVAATWWVGVGIGVPLACAARLGKLPKVAPGWLVPAVGRLLLAMFGIAMAGLILTLFLGMAKLIPASLFKLVPFGVPEARQVGFLADGVAHNLSYGVGFFGGISLWIQTLLRRRLQPREAAIESPSA